MTDAPAGAGTAAIVARVGDAVTMRARLRSRPLRVTVAALAEAARRWRADEALAQALPAAARLSPAMIAAVLPVAADALDAGAMAEVIEREWGAGAAGRPPAAGPTVVAHVLASNVPALALPAIALGCLAGAAVVVKSGRDDPLSAPAFQRALAAVDPELAATVVTVYWPGGAHAVEDAVLARADVVVATGGDGALAALGARVGARLVAHGPRWSVALVGGDGTRSVGAVAAAIARDIVAHDQRGCLSPHALYVAGGPDAARALAEALADALEGETLRLPPGPSTVEERAAARVFRAGAEWEPDTVILGAAEGSVVHHGRPATFRPTCGRRTVRVHPLPSLHAFPACLPAGAIECVGVTATDPTPLVESLRARGVARLCPAGRMQQPRLTWPRGQLPPLGALLRRHTPPEIEVEPCVTS